MVFESLPIVIQNLPAQTGPLIRGSRPNLLSVHDCCLEQFINSKMSFRNSSEARNDTITV
jgi:hypothetical protein